MAVPPRSVASRSWVRRPAEKVPRAGLARSRGGHGAGGWPGAAREMEPRDRAGGRRFGVEGPGGPRRGSAGERAGRSYGEGSLARPLQIISRLGG